MAFEPKKYKIEKIKSYSPDVKVFTVKSNMNPAPGTFIEVSVLGKGECPLASCSYNGKYLDILTRKVGNVTSAMFKLKKGDELYIRGPYGKGYPFEELKGKDLILVAGGTGLAPVTSLVEYILKNRKDFGKVILFVGFRDGEHILLGDRFKKWRNKIEIVLSLDKKSDKIKTYVGFVHDVMKKYNKKLSEFKSGYAVLCGPEQMMLSVTNTLNSIGIKNDKILWNMERRMECAIGSCGRCLLCDVYVCRDGPVFKYSTIKEKIEHEASE